MVAGQANFDGLASLANEKSGELSRPLRLFRKPVTITLAAITPAPEIQLLIAYAVGVQCLLLTTDAVAQ